MSSWIFAGEDHRDPVQAQAYQDRQTTVTAGLERSTEMSDDVLLVLHKKISGHGFLSFKEMKQARVEIERLRAEVERLTHGSICEVGASNANVLEYMWHWEERAEKAEAAVERLKAALRDCMDYVDVENITMQHKQARWLAVLNGGDWQPGNLGVEEERGDE
jgi:chromosome condensin MukBEF ATPase and DNA-binding subunit MukB